MIISSEIENVEKVENLTKKIANGEKHFKNCQFDFPRFHGAI